MFDKNDYDRLRAWAEFRNSLEQSDNPINDTINLYNKAPTVSISMDPWDQTTWLNPWELLQENQYCSFSKILGIFYTLQLCERFSKSNFEIHICTDNENSEVKYLLKLDDIVIGYEQHEPVAIDFLPKNLTIDLKYSLSDN